MKSVITILTSFIISVFIPIIILLYDKHYNEIMPVQDHSVLPGFVDTIYYSKFNRKQELVLDICNRNKNSLSNPELIALPDTSLQKIALKAYDDSITKRSVLYVLDAQRQITDSITVTCFDCSTVGVTVPADGYLVLKCVRGCLNNFCSYEFVRL